MTARGFPNRRHRLSIAVRLSPAGEAEGVHPMADAKSDKLKAIEGAVSQIERQFGKGSIMRLGAHEILGIEFIPTGSLAVDYAIGIGGFPRGRVVEIYGPESSGKTTLAL